MRRTLTIIVQHPTDQDKNPDKDIRSSIQVLVLPADESLPRLEILETTYEPITSPSRSMTLNKTSGFSSSVLYHNNAYFGQPNVRFLPKLTEKHWPFHAWAHRAVCRTRNYHVFFTQGKEGRLAPNDFMGQLVSGDMLILKLSNRVGQDGRWSYEDILPGATQMQAVRLVEMIFGSEEWICDMVAGLRNAARKSEF